MAQKKPLTREQHIQNCRWAEESGDLVHDAVNLLWSTYGVSSKIGQLGDRLRMKNDGLWPSFESCALSFDKSIPAIELRPRTFARTSLPLAEQGIQPPNRFAFNSIGCRSQFATEFRIVA